LYTLLTAQGRIPRKNTMTPVGVVVECAAGFSIAGITDTAVPAKIAELPQPCSQVTRSRNQKKLMRMVAGITHWLRRFCSDPSVKAPPMVLRKADRASRKPMTKNLPQGTLCFRHQRRGPPRAVNAFHRRITADLSGERSQRRVGAS
jgi:hypothetical protein